MTAAALAQRGISILPALTFAGLTMALGWFAGGQGLLGRIDPALVLPILFVPAWLFAVWLGPRDIKTRIMTMALSVAVLLAVQTLLMARFGHSFAAAQLLCAGTGAAAALCLADILWQRREAVGRPLRIAMALMFVLGWFGAGHALLASLYATGAPSAQRPVVTMMTSLPMRWTGIGDVKSMLAGGTQSATALVKLEKSFRVELVDSLVDPPMDPSSTLLLAHPRALAPEELVAIDAYVRKGGHAVILADALSGWPIDYPIGNPRNPPVTSLLTPLLDHWGITLDAAAPNEAKTTTVWLDGYRLSLFSAGRFSRLPTGCRVFSRHLVTHCPIGLGNVWLVGDADLLFAPLWHPIVDGAAHLQRSDNMSWLIRRLDAKKALRHAWLRPVWISPVADSA